MATLKDYFELDLKTMSYSKVFSFLIRDTGKMVDIIGRLHLDFESNSMFISYYIPCVEALQCPALLALAQSEQVLALREEIYTELKIPGTEGVKSSELKFTGKIIVYDENEQRAMCDDEVKRQAEESGHYVHFRRNSYAVSRAASEKPLAFVSHDSRDKELIAKPIVHELISLSCPVWFDEYSLNIGDSLRESIEKGIKDTKKCILILTPNFLSNPGWTKTEFNSVFTRDILRNTRSILPIWHNITKEEVFEYCTALLDIVALVWPLKDDYDAKNKQKTMRLFRKSASG